VIFPERLLNEGEREEVQPQVAAELHRPSAPGRTDHGT
jgi:hypothetical protein